MSVKLPIEFYTVLKAWETLMLIFSVSILAFYLLKKQFKLFSYANTKKEKSIEDLPALKAFPFWTPWIIEGLAIAYGAFKCGIRVSFELWALTNYSPLTALSTPNFQKVIFVSDPELIKKCLSSLDSRLLNKPQFIYDKIFTNVAKGGLFASRYDVWKRHRKILNKLFTYATLQEQQKIADKCAQQLVDNLHVIDSSAIEFNQFRWNIYDTTLQIILETLMGPQIVKEKGYRKIIDKFRTLKYLIQYRLFRPHYLNDILWKMTSKGKLQHECLSYIQDYFEDGIDRVINLGKTVNDCCAVGHMLKNNMSKKEIREEMATLVAAGHETTDLNIHLIMQHLGEHLEIQQKCQEEVDAVFGSKVSTNITMDDLAKLKYLEQCILETLRITPIAPAYGRELTDSIELDKVILKKGTILLFCPWMVHRHPDYYPDPEKFDPDRFSVDKVQARHHYAFIPFSLGPRNCIGWKVAIMEMKTIMFWIIKHFHICTKDRLADVKMSFELNVLPERKFNIWLKKRNENCKDLTR